MRFHGRICLALQRCELEPQRLDLCEAVVPLLREARDDPLLLVELDHERILRIDVGRQARFVRGAVPGADALPVLRCAFHPGDGIRQCDFETDHLLPQRRCVVVRRLERLAIRLRHRRQSRHLGIPRLGFGSGFGHAPRGFSPPLEGRELLFPVDDWFWRDRDDENGVCGRNQSRKLDGIPFVPTTATGRVGHPTWKRRVSVANTQRSSYGWFGIVVVVGATITKTSAGHAGVDERMRG